ncbi:bacterial transcriptional regulator family protein [Paraburkholderia xenovorans LB400]|nr:helix-turn-helix domain-containing protein [Paraburkholderia xenovorans]AIP32357.1 bacterial transcriptional regulator family protein [Paraburkholderia xenovorans LB400]
MTDRNRSDSSTDRILGLLDLFTIETPTWTVDALIETTGLARATMYRYVRSLTDSGFLVPIGKGAYALGPKFIEIDRQLRLADPLLQIGQPIMTRIEERVAGAQLLCRYYGLRVLTIYKASTDERLEKLMSMERGRPFPLFLGAPSRVILANLPSHQLQRLYLYHAQEIAAAGLGDSWVAFRDRMRDVRKAGYAKASDIDKALVGISAPIFAAPGVVTASLCLVRLGSEVSAEDERLMADLVIETAAELSSKLQGVDTPITQNPVKSKADSLAKSTAKSPAKTVAKTDRSPVKKAVRKRAVAG